MEQRTTNHKGANFTNIEICSAAGGVTADKIKIKMAGNLSVNMLTNSYKYKDEVQLQVYGKDFIQVPRTFNNRWNRVEIFIPAYQIDNLILALEKAKEHLKGGNKESGEKSSSREK